MAANKNNMNKSQIEGPISDYDLKLDEVIEEIKRENAKIVCIQLADGLKPFAGHIKDEIEKKSNTNVIIWGGSCFGACDIPIQLKGLGVDLIIQFGHSAWR